MLLTVSDSANGIIQFLTVFVIFVFVVAITLFTTRWIGNYQKGKSLGANIEVIETYKITNNKYVQIIRMGEKYLAIAIGKDEITFLTELTEDGIHLTENVSEPMLDFASVLEKIKNYKK